LEPLAEKYQILTTSKPPHCQW